MTFAWFALVLVSDAAVLAVYWILRFRSVLPLENALVDARAEIEDRDSFARDLLEILAPYAEDEADGGEAKDNSKRRPSGSKLPAAAE